MREQRPRPHLPAYFSNLGPSETAVMPYTMAYGSRLIPREKFDRNRELNGTVTAFRALSETGHDFNGYRFVPMLKSGRPVGGGNAVLPEWHDAFSHVIAFAR